MKRALGWVAFLKVNRGGFGCLEVKRRVRVDLGAYLISHSGTASGRDWLQREKGVKSALKRLVWSDGNCDTFTSSLRGRLIDPHTNIHV